MNLKKNLTTLIASTLFLFFACSKEVKLGSSEKDKATQLNPQAERDFKRIDSLKGYFCDFPQECELYENKSTFLEKRRFEDRVYKNRMQLALDYLESYPDDPRYYEVLKFYFHLNFEPHFVAEKISDNVKVFLSKDFGKNITTGLLEQRRVLPIDMQAKTKWLEKGYALAEKFLGSDAPRENKLKIEIAVLARDFRFALRQYQSLEKDKKGIESEFWKRFDKQYWESFRLRTNGLLEKYADLEIMGTYVQQLIALISVYSPALSKPYWNDFLEFTDNDHLLSESAGFKTVHNLAEKNLITLRSFDMSKPLDMAFTAIDGAKVDLADMRGKVVLIDFWSIRCAPCIKEMPHVQVMYEKYRSQGFEVIGLAGDDERARERVLKIIKKQNATWPQYLDKGKDAKVSYHALYKINSYPTVWLLNKEGIVVDKNARGVRLEPLIRKHLGLEK